MPNTLLHSDSAGILCWMRHHLQARILLVPCVAGFLSDPVLLADPAQPGHLEAQSFGGVNPAGAAQWHDLKFGLMLHWGLYSVAGGVWNGTNVEGYNEQIKHRAKIPSEEYYQLTNQFRAERFDPDFIARIAKEAGMRHVVITSKHHEGFNLWHSHLSDFNAVNATPFGKDAIKLLSDACARHGMKFGVYYSLIDWHYPGAADTIQSGNGAIPKLVFGSRWVIPEAQSADDLVLILQNSLAVPNP